MKFGFLIDKKEFECVDFSIETVENYDEVINTFYEFVKVSNGWIYGPAEDGIGVTESGSGHANHLNTWQLKAKNRHFLGQ